jgi:hypothetical protein
VVEEVQAPVLEVDPVGSVFGNEVEADEERIPVPKLFVDAVRHDLVVREGSGGLTDNAASERADLLPGRGRKLIEVCHS